MGAVPVKKKPRRPVARDLWKEAVDRAFRVSGKIFRGLCQREVAITVALGVVLIGSGLGVTYNAHLNRQLFGELSDLQADRDAYQRQWTQLLLEQSALSAHSHIERQAADKLSMKVPERDEIVVITRR